MNHSPNDLHALTQRVAAGDVQARNQLEQQLGRHLERIVRRSLRHGGASGLDAAIHAEAGRLTEQPQADPQRWASPVANVLGQRLLQRLWPGGTLPGGKMPGQDTLVSLAPCT